MKRLKIFLLTLSIFSSSVYAYMDAIIEGVMRGAAQVAVEYSVDRSVKGAKGFSLFESDEEKQTREAQEAAVLEIEKAKAQRKALIETPEYQQMLLDIEKVKDNPSLIKDMDNPKEEVLLAAVETDGKVIQYIKEPSKKVQLKAVKQTPDAYQYIKNPYKRVSRYYERNK